MKLFDLSDAEVAQLLEDANTKRRGALTKQYTDRLGHFVVRVEVARQFPRHPQLDVVDGFPDRSFNTEYRGHVLALNRETNLFESKKAPFLASLSLNELLHRIDGYEAGR